MGEGRRLVGERWRLERAIFAGVRWNLVAGAVYIWVIVDDVNLYETSRRVGNVQLRGPTVGEI